MSYALGWVYWWLGHAMIKNFPFYSKSYCFRSSSSTCFISFGCCINVYCWCCLLTLWKSGFGQPQKRACVCHCQNLRLCMQFSQWIDVLIAIAIKKHTHTQTIRNSWWVFRQNPFYFSLLSLPKTSITFLKNSRSKFIFN